MRRYASVPGVTGSWTAISWSKRDRGSAATARASSAERRESEPRRSTITISLPRPFIFRKRRFASALTAGSEVVLEEGVDFAAIWAESTAFASHAASRLAKRIYGRNTGPGARFEAVAMSLHHCLRFAALAVALGAGALASAQTPPAAGVPAPGAVESAPLPVPGAPPQPAPPASSPPQTATPAPSPGGARPTLVPEPG